MEKTMNREKIIEAVKNIPIVAEKNSWAIALDKDEGTLFYAPKNIPTNSELHQVTDEYAIYLDENLNPNGIVVEYFRANFLKHHELFKDVTQKVFGDGKSDNNVVTIKSEQLEKNKL